MPVRKYTGRAKGALKFLIVFIDGNGRTYLLICVEKSVRFTVMDVPATSGIFRISPRNRLLIFTVVTLLLFGLVIFVDIEAFSDIFANVLFLPVILACYWYPRRGIFIAILLAAIYGGITIFLIPMGQINIPVLLFQMVFFILVGAVISVLSSRLSRSEQQLHSIIEFLPDAIFAIDREGKVIAWNRAIEILTGVPKEKMLGKGDFEYSIPFYGDRRPVLLDCIIHDDKEIRCRYPEIVDDGERLSSEQYIPNFQGGKGIHVWVSAKALRDEDGNIIGAIESVRDITEKVLTQTALATTGNRLNTIAGIIRHDLSKKLAVLYGQLSMAVMKFDDPLVISFIGEVKESAASIQRLVEISRAFRDIGTEPPQWIPVQKTIMESVKRIDLGDAKFRSWTERLEVFADPNLGTAFFHLLENTKKISHGAERIVVTYRIQNDGCCIFLEDNGTGFPESVKKDLFQQGKENCGSGLYLTHEILSITGITIRETGVSGMGVRFEILVPPEGYRVV